MGMNALQRCRRTNRLTLIRPGPLVVLGSVSSPRPNTRGMARAVSLATCVAHLAPSEGISAAWWCARVKHRSTSIVTLWLNFCSDGAVTILPRPKSITYHIISISTQRLSRHVLWCTLLAGPNCPCITASGHVSNKTAMCLSTGI